MELSCSLHCFLKGGLQIVPLHAERLLKHCAGVELASGVHYFLKRACKSSISWRLTGGNQIDTSCLEPAALAASNLDVYQERSVPWSYYQNVVTPRSAHSSAATCKMFVCGSPSFL